MKHISLNYGNNNITDARIFRVFGSAFFNSAVADTRRELSKVLDDEMFNKSTKG